MSLGKKQIIYLFNILLSVRQIFIRFRNIVSHNCFREYFDIFFFNKNRLEIYILFLDFSKLSLNIQCQNSVLIIWLSSSISDILFIFSREWDELENNIALHYVVMGVIDLHWLSRKCVRCTSLTSDFVQKARIYLDCSVWFAIVTRAIIIPLQRKFGGI